MTPGENSAEAAPGFFSSLSSLGKNLAGLLGNRIELAALEWSEVRANLIRLALVGAAALLVSWFAIAYWSVLIVYLAWESMGWLILLLLAAGFTAAGVGLLMYARSLLRQGKLSMPATMSELRKDIDTLV